MDTTSGKSPIITPAARPKRLILGSEKKWMWLAIIVSGPLAGFTGFILGLGLLFEPEHRRRGWLLIAWAIAWNIVVFFLTLWLVRKGYIPQFKVAS